MNNRQSKMKRRMGVTVLISVCLILFFEIKISEGLRQSDKSRKNNDKKHEHMSSDVKNICDNTDRNSKMHCYCQESIAIKNATRAECWIFSVILTDDSIWDEFQHQNRILDLKFNIRIDGSFYFVPTRALKYLRRLRRLTIEFANIETVHSYAFANLTSLKELSVTRNRIVSLEPHAFAHMWNLTTLTVAENRISEIGQNCFVDLPVLQKLNLTSNNISSIADGAFKQLVQLLELYLRKNSIHSLTKESFDGLANLKKLNLMGNRLRTLGDFTFSELWNLQELELDGNELKFISERAFDGLSQLKKLSLSKNRLTELTGGLFEGVRGLSYLDMSDNRLHTLTIDDIRPILDNLKNTSSDLILDGNDFFCDCRLTWMHVLRNDTKNEDTRSGLEQIVCNIDAQNQIDNTISKHKPLDNMDNKYQGKSKHKVLSHKTTIEYVDQSDNNDFNVHDEAQKDSQKNPGNINHTKTGYQKHLFHIPVEHLPCPEELKDSTESPLLRPSRGEVKDFRGINSGQMNNINTYLFILIAALIKLF